MMSHNDWAHRIRGVLSKHINTYPVWADGFIYDLAEYLSRSNTRQLPTRWEVMYRSKLMRASIAKTVELENLKIYTHPHLLDDRDVLCLVCAKCEHFIASKMLDSVPLCLECYNGTKQNEKTQ